MKKLLETAEEVVKQILTDIPETRDDDFKLLYYAYKRYKSDIDIYSFKDVMFNHSYFGLPSFETIRRVRPKLQNKYPELQAVKFVQQKRKEFEKDYKEFVLEDKKTTSKNCNNYIHLW